MIPRYRVLVAEDDFLVSEAIDRALKKVGFECAGRANNGEKAIELACSLKPDVILMDIKMPKVDGLEAARKIQELMPTPIVILTAYESTELVVKATDTGISAYLIKPPEPDEIMRAINCHNTS